MVGFALVREGALLVEMLVHDLCRDDPLMGEHGMGLET